jgi:hypothetical protein
MAKVKLHVLGIPLLRARTRVSWKHRGVEPRVVDFSERKVRTTLPGKRALAAGMVVVDWKRLLRRAAIGGLVVGLSAGFVGAGLYPMLGRWGVELSERALQRR